MDNITHFVLGAAIGEVVAGKQLGKKAMLWGGIAANIPDIDVLLAPFQSVPDSLLSHRGLTHSIFFCVLSTLLLSRVMQRWKRSGSKDFKLWVIVFSTGIFSHILLDACTIYGTGWYEPFSHHRVAFNNIFVADPFYTLPMLVSFIALVYLRQGVKARKWWNIFGLGLSALYMFFTFINKINTDRIVEKNLATTEIKPLDYITTPTAFNNFLWYIVVKDDQGFYTGYHSIFDHSDHVKFQYVPQHKSFLTPYLEEEGVDKLVRFSQGYYSITKDSTRIDFHDLRFGQIGGWDDKEAPFAFSYHFGKDEDNDLVIQRGRFDVANKETFNSLIDRIKGK